MRTEPKDFDYIAVFGKPYKEKETKPESGWGFSYFCVHCYTVIIQM